MIASVYIHIPFCSHKCDFCDFTAFAGLDHLAESYVEAVCKEIELRLKHCAKPQAVTTVYYGGGTPGLVDPQLIGRVHSVLRRYLEIDCNAEVTLETTPDTITFEKAKLWQSIGINRLSIGVESLQDDELTAVGRGQDVASALTGIEIARRSGFKNVSLDFMYGLPTQTLESWNKTLNVALSLHLPHLSAYGLTISAKSPLLTRFPVGVAEYPDEQIWCRMYEIVVKNCRDAGLAQYEVSNFAYPGFECRHNQTYWRNEEYYAFGVGAHRYVNDVRSSNTRSLKQYLRNCVALEMEETIDSQTRLKEGIVLALRTRHGIDLSSFRERYGMDIQQRYSVLLDRLGSGGFIEISQGKMRLSQKGVMVSNSVLSEFC